MRKNLRRHREKQQFKRVLAQIPSARPKATPGVGRHLALALQGGQPGLGPRARRRRGSTRPGGVPREAPAGRPSRGFPGAAGPRGGEGRRRRARSAPRARRRAAPRGALLGLAAGAPPSRPRPALGPGPDQPGSGSLSKVPEWRERGPQGPGGPEREPPPGSVVWRGLRGTRSSRARGAAGHLRPAGPVPSKKRVCRPRAPAAPRGRAALGTRGGSGAGTERG